MNLQSLRDRLIVSLIAIVVVFTVTFTWIMASSTYSQSTAGAKERLFKDASQLTESIETWISTNSRVIQSLSEEQEKKIGDLTSIDFARRSGNFFNTYVGNETGNFFIQPTTNMPADYDPRVRAWYKNGLASNKPTISKPYIGKPSGYRMVTFAKSIIVDGKAVGVSGASVLLSTISDSVLADKYYNDGFATLIDKNGVIQIHRDESMLNKPITDLIPSIQQNTLDQWANSGDVTQHSVSGKDHLVTLTPVSNHDWYVVTGLENAIIYANTQSLIMRFIILGILAIAILTTFGFIMINRLLKPLHVLSQTMEDIAHGEADLTQRLDEKGSSELERVAVSFNLFIQRMQETLQQTRLSSEKLTAVAGDARTDSNNNQKQIDTQLGEIQQVASAIDDMASTAGQMAESAREAANAAGDSAENSQKGMDFAQLNQENMSKLDGQVEQATTAIQELNDHSQQISSILSTIQGIAEQTNLLALNAAIEAARAGEQGRGFAVVADEVRSLSQRTHEATEEIQKMILTLQERSKSAVNIMDVGRDLAKSTKTNTEEVAQQLHSIHAAIHSISEMSENIAKASSDQKQASQSINQLMDTINNASETISQIGGSALDRANTLDDLGNSIYSDLKTFKL
ncbi:MAG: methyl-accepting chemotaxis protein [Cellvibrionaceae bacterium]